MLFLYHAQFLSNRNSHHWDLNPGQFFGVVTFVPVISLPKQTTLVLVSFFYRAYFLSWGIQHAWGDKKCIQNFGWKA
jgi:hypothetical protein